MRNAGQMPWLAIGLTLAVLGFGNWYTGLDKSRQYEALLRKQAPPANSYSSEEFPALTASMNRALLRPLRRADSSFTTVTGKLDFYRLVRSGGEMMMLAGLFVTAAALIHQAYQRHQADHGV